MLLVSVLFELISVFLPLVVVSRLGSTGWVITTLGMAAVLVAVRHRRSERGVFLSITEGGLGVIGTILCGWSLAASYVLGRIPAVASSVWSLPRRGLHFRSQVPKPARGRQASAASRAAFRGADIVPGTQHHGNLRSGRIGIRRGAAIREIARNAVVSVDRPT